LKAKLAPSKPPHREIFVLTPEEKRIVCCVLIALVAGVMTKHYRETHPRPLPAKSKINARGRAPLPPSPAEDASPRHP
jgi:hypothetical protein